MKNARIPQGYRCITIEGLEHYAMNKNGDIINLNTGRKLRPNRNKVHWSGRVSLYDSVGARYAFNRSELLKYLYSRVTNKELAALSCSNN